MGEEKNKDSAKYLFRAEFLSMFFGFMFGSVFGYENMLDPVYHALGWKGKPMTVMESVNTVLLIAIGIGIGLMVVAMLLNIYVMHKA